MPCLFKTTLAFVCTLTILTRTAAQSPVLELTTTYISTSSTVTDYDRNPAANSNSFRGCSGNQFDYNFNQGSDNALKLVSFLANGRSYFIANSTAARVALRRVDNANVSGNRTVVSMEAAGGSSVACPSGRRLDIRLPYQDTMELFLNNNFINQGTDNIFTNNSNGDGNNNNIERVDILFPQGLSSANPADAGFAIFDRGNNRGHDGFRITAITGLDANGDPASFGAVKTCTKGNGSGNGNWGHPGLADGNIKLSTYVLRKEGNESRLKASAAINGQEIGGVFFSFADLGIASGQKIYGYAVLSTDGIASPSSAQLLDIYDTDVYPTNTTESYGGLDMMAVNAVFSSGGTPLASTGTLLEGKVAGKNAVLRWPSLPASGTVELERSADGREYAVVYRLSVQQLSGGSHTEPAAGAAYYRLRIRKVDGSLQWSNVVRLEGKMPGLSVYPSFVSGHKEITIEGLPDGAYTAFFTDMGGRVYKAGFHSLGARTKLPVWLPSGFRGMAWLYFTGSGGELYPGGKIIFQ